jgi:hypothetical protein
MSALDVITEFDLDLHQSGVLYIHINLRYNFIIYLAAGLFYKRADIRFYKFWDNMRTVYRF